MASTVDLGKVVGATGPKGDTGPKGATGPAGPKGTDGTKIYAQTICSNWSSDWNSLD